MYVRPFAMLRPAGVINLLVACTIVLSAAQIFLCKTINYNDIRLVRSCLDGEGVACGASMTCQLEGGGGGVLRLQ